jgi:tripartite-type tricarboxylate transporter receptor subunit TctC
LQAQEAHSLRRQRRALLAAGAGWWLAAHSVGARAQSGYPDRPIKLVVPFPPGGSVDTVARALAPQLSAQLNQPVVIDNRPGANSVIGAQQVRRAPADGYTLLLNASLQVVNPLIMTAANYDVEKDFVPVAYLGALPQLVVVSASSPYATLQDLINDARKRPGRVQWATSAYGAAGHLAAELIRLRAAVDTPIVPYKGGAPALTDLIGQHVSAMVEPMASAYPHVKSGRLKALAVTTPQRLPGLPDIPTVAESGFTGFDMPSWYGVWAPSGTPAPVVDRLYQELRVAMDAPAVKEKLSSMFFQARVSTPVDFAAFIRKEGTMVKELAAKAKIKVED